MPQPEDLFLHPDPHLDLNPSEGGSKDMMQAIITAQAIAAIAYHHAWSGLKARSIIQHRAWSAISPQPAAPVEFLTSVQIQ